MPSVDINADYKKIQDKVASTKTYTDVKSQYDGATKKIGNSFDKKKAKVSQSLTEFKDKTKRYQKQIKNQFEELLDLANTTGGQGSGSPQYIKRLLIRTIKNVQPRLRTIVIADCLTALGCDQQQTYNPNSDIYLRVGSVDLFSRLKIDPQDEVGKIIYEKDSVTPSSSTYPFSMNRKMYGLIQDGTEFTYVGKSNQDLFKIQYVEKDPNGIPGPWYHVTLSGRNGNINRVGEFMVDYYDTIRMAEDTDIIGSIMESLCGALSIKASAGISQVENASKYELILARILGLCFDNRTEIDVSGIAKVAELDGVDDSFFEFTEIDLRNIDDRVQNIKKGVVQFEDCDNILLPVNFDEIVTALGTLNFYKGSEFENAADNITSVLANNPAWIGLGINNVDAKLVVDENFIKLLTNGLIGALLTPKMILPILTMYKALGNTIDNIKSFVDFAKTFKKFFINLVSKVGAIFVEELYKLIKEDILKLAQQVIVDIVKEKQMKKYAMILKLIGILLAIIKLISDYRKCKSLIDDLLNILNLVTAPSRGIPLPLLFASQLLDGYSETRAFIGTIGEMQKAGIFTGAMPSGAPNFDVLSKLGQMKAMAFENAENGKTQIAVGPLTITPAGFTILGGAHGKSF